LLVAGRNGVLGTRVRALLLPKPLDEIRDPRDKVTNAKSVDAAAGMKSAAAGVEDAIAGASLYGVKDASSRRAIREGMLSEAEEESALSKIHVFKGDVLYHVLEEYSRWVEAQRLAGAKAEMDLLIRPGKIKLLKGFVFRRSDPAIVGVEVLDGIVKPKYPLIN